MNNLPVIENKSDNIITVGPGGVFRKTDTFRSTPSDIDMLFKRFSEAGTKNIALYFHGGLVKQADGIQIAEDVMPYLIAAGVEPVCFVWETGLFETISSNITKISQTRLFVKVIKMIATQLPGLIGGGYVFSRGNGKLSETEILEELEKAYPFIHFDDVDSIESDVNERSGNNAAFLDKIELQGNLRRYIERDDDFVNAIENANLTANDSARGGEVVTLTAFIEASIEIISLIISRHRNGTDHGFFPTLVEEVLRKFYIAEAGAWIWSAMKEKAEVMWKGNVGVQEKYVGKYFLEKLTQYALEHNGVIVDMIGHSAGSIVICHLVEAIREQQLNFRIGRIAFMAPACRVELFNKAIVPFHTMFEGIRIYTMSDKYECGDAMVPYFYTRSLLYLISGILEDEGKQADARILGLERHIKYAAPYDTEDMKTLHEFLYEDYQNRIVFSQTISSALEGLRSTSLSHGGFDDNECTLKSIQHFLMR